MPSIGSKRIVKKSLLLVLFVSLIFVSLRLQFALLQKIPVQDANQTFIVERGDSLYGILSNLEEKYNLSSTWWIRFKYMFKESPVIKAGRYNIFPNTTVSELIERFEDGDVQLFKIAIIEGTVAKNNLVNLENIIEDQNLNFEVPQTLQSPYEALVLASIIEREAVLPSEQEKIASVFLSRLNIDMKLQADPTSSYGFYGDYGKKIGRAVLDDKNPYNTYQNKGLPPGPICYPSKGAIDAAIKSSPGEFYYFVAKGDGSHIFSKTYEEHNKAVKKYIYSK